MTKPFGVVEESEKWIVPCEGGVVTRCYLDYGFGFLIWCGNETIEVRIEGEFVLDREGTELRLYPGEEPTSFAPALTILHRNLEGLAAYKDGRLEVGSSGGVRIFVPAHAEFEAWKVRGANGLLLVALPGGGVGVWGA